MSRLIDAESLIENIKLLLNRSFVGEISPQNEVSIGEIATLIKDEPVAYDVDAVLDQLENCGNHRGVLKREDEKCESYIPVSLAIQIVKGQVRNNAFGYMRK